MRFARTSVVLAVLLLAVAGSNKVGAQEVKVQVGYYSLFEVTIGDYVNGAPVVLNEYAAGSRGDGTHDTLRVQKDSTGTAFAQRLIVDQRGNIVAEDGLLICDGTEESRVRLHSVTVFTYALRATDKGLDMTVIADDREPGAAHREPRLFIVNHYRGVAGAK